MKATVKIANVYDSILDETRKELVIVRNRRSFIGALFFEKEEWETVKSTIEKVEIEGSALDIIIKAYELKKKHNMIAKDDKTLLTMLHWQFINGLTDEMISAYGFKNDTEYLARISK